MQPAAVRGLSLVVARVAVVGFPLQPAAGRGLWGPLAPVVAVCRLSSPMACGIFPDQGLNPCPLHWQADSHPLYHQESFLLALYMADLLFSCIVAFTNEIFSFIIFIFLVAAFSFCLKKSL